MDELKEKLAEIEHQRWADWQSWVHKVFYEQFSPEIMEVIQPVLDRWDKQIATPYQKLSKAEKASDMEQVDRYWPLIQDYCDKQSRGARIDGWKEYKHVLEMHGKVIADQRLAELESAPINKGDVFLYPTTMDLPPPPDKG